MSTASVFVRRKSAAILLISSRFTHVLPIQTTHGILNGATLCVSIHFQHVTSVPQQANSNNLKSDMSNVCRFFYNSIRFNILFHFKMNTIICYIQFSLKMIKMVFAISIFVYLKHACIQAARAACLEFLYRASPKLYFDK